MSESLILPRTESAMERLIDHINKWGPYLEWNDDVICLFDEIDRLDKLCQQYKQDALLTGDYH